MRHKHHPRFGVELLSRKDADVVSLHVGVAYDHFAFTPPENDVRNDPIVDDDRNVVFFKTVFDHAFELLALFDDLEIRTAVAHRDAVDRSTRRIRYLRQTSARHVVDEGVGVGRLDPHLLLILGWINSKFRHHARDGRRTLDTHLPKHGLRVSIHAAPPVIVLAAVAIPKYSVRREFEYHRRFF